MFSVGLAILSAVIGCAVSTHSPGRSSVSTTTVRDRNHAFYERAHAGFAKALLHKPRDGSMHGQPFELAPLLVHEAARGALDGNRFGALEEAAEGVVRVNANLQTVYVESGKTDIGGISYDTLTYRWFYSMDTPCGPSIVEKAQRVVLGVDGFGLVHETMSAELSSAGDDGVRTLFVSASFESAAATYHGRALDGRRFACERSLEDVPETVVVAVVEDGPIPMGPYVYVSAPTGRITTLLCRCSPSQMDEVVESAYYDLVPFDRVIGLLAQTQLYRASVDAMLDRPLDEVLRWPH